MKKSFALFALALVLIMAFGSFLAFAAEAETGDAFDPEALVVGGVALAPLISVLISILKGWVGIDKKYIPLVNVLLGTVAVLVVGVNSRIELAFFLTVFWAVLTRGKRAILTLF